MPRKGGAYNSAAKFDVKDDDDDEGSDDNYDDNDFDEDEKDVDADKKLENLRKAMQRENVKAVKYATKVGVDGQAKKNDGKPVLKMGPSTKPAMDMAALKRAFMPTDTSNLVIPGQVRK